MALTSRASQLVEASHRAFRQVRHPLTSSSPVSNLGVSVSWRLIQAGSASGRKWSDADACLSLAGTFLISSLPSSPPSTTTTPLLWPPPEAPVERMKFSRLCVLLLARHQTSTLPDFSPTQLGRSVLARRRPVSVAARHGLTDAHRGARGRIRATDAPTAIDLALSATSMPSPTCSTRTAAACRNFSR
jgi:hypothetical protein